MRKKERERVPDWVEKQREERERAANLAAAEADRGVEEEAVAARVLR